MPDNIMEDKCITVGGETQWHGIGPHFDVPMSAEEGHVAIGGSFELTTWPAGYFDDEGFHLDPDRMVILRGKTKGDPRKIVFDYVTDGYKVIQPIDIVRKFDEKVGVSISTMGFLQEGNKMFLSWEMPSFEVIKGDEIKTFATVLMGFDAMFSCRLIGGTERVVCRNTWLRALAQAEKEKNNRNRGVFYKGKHTNPNMLYELGEWMEYVQINAVREIELVQSLFKKFVETPIIHEKQAEDLIYTAWPNPEPLSNSYPENLKEKESLKIEKETERVTKIRDGVFDTFVNPIGIDVTEDYYGLFNASTQWFNHIYPSKKDASLSILWGNRADEMNLFAEVLRKDIESKND